jgi:hypothetical protein
MESAKNIGADTSSAELNLLGIYLKIVRDEYAHHGAARKPNLGLRWKVLASRLKLG